MNAWLLCATALFCIIFSADFHSIRKSNLGARTQVVLHCATIFNCLFHSLVVKWDKTEPVILEFATIICKLVAKQSWVVCDGISGQFRDEFFYVFRRLSDERPSKICGLLLNECADPDDVTQSGWMVELPPKPSAVMKKRIEKRRFKHTHSKNGRNRNLRVLQLTDLHVDFEYRPGSEADCDLPVCCREEAQSPRKAAGYWGTVGKCDIPYWTFKNMLEHINATHEIDYIMLSGDFINHFDWSYTVDEHVATLRNLSSLVRRYFPTTPTYWAIGNHEGVPVNSFAPHFVEERFWPIWLYNEFVNMSKPWLTSDSAKTVLYRGSYSVKVADGLRLISLNSGFCETTNFFLYLNQSDPDGTMSWSILFQAELSGDSVHVLSHIPPGDGECLEGWARNYYRIIQRFSDTVQAQFFGHIHADYFTIFYEDMHNTSSEPTGVLYAAPSATTFSDMNPAYRIYDIDFTDHFVSPIFGFRKYILLMISLL
ncbi:Ser/Thr phosphatase family protein, partial [Ancylostoma caninum]